MIFYKETDKERFKRHTERREEGLGEDKKFKRREEFRDKENERG